MSRPVPYFAQEKDYSCGPASIRMALAAFGQEVDERTLRRRMKTGFVFGTRHHQLARAARAYGLYARATTGASFDDLERALGAGRVVIANFVEPTASASHLAPVTALEADRVVLNDPWHGATTSLPREEFKQRWQSKNRLGKGNWYRGWMLEVSDAPIPD